MSTGNPFNPLGTPGNSTGSQGARELLEQVFEHVVSLNTKSNGPQGSSKEPESPPPPAPSTPPLPQSDIHPGEESPIEAFPHPRSTSIFVDGDGQVVTFPSDPQIKFINYESEKQMPAIQQLIEKDLSEPYSIYTYRYFIHNWPNLCFLAMHDDNCVGAIVCKLDLHKNTVYRGYIAMLAVHKDYRKRFIGTSLVVRAIEAMAAQRAAEVVLETEVTNKPALRLYENLGFVRDKRLYRYYLSGVDALRLKLWLSFY